MKENLKTKLYDLLYGLDLKDLKTKDISRLYDKILEILKEEGIDINLEL